MDKKTKRQIDKKVSDFERECLIEMLFESDDGNVEDVLEQALMAVKLVHSEEIAEEVEEHRQKLIEEAEEKKAGLADMERMIKEMERCIDHRDQDMWKKVKIHDYWDITDKRKLPEWTTSRWITTSTISTDKLPETIIDPTKLLNKWFTKLDKK